MPKREKPDEDRKRATRVNQPTSSSSIVPSSSRAGRSTSDGQPRTGRVSRVRPSQIDDSSPSTSQASQENSIISASQASQSSASQILDENDVQQLASELCGYLWAMERQKRPARRQVITTTILPGHGRAMKQILRATKELMMDLCGFSVKEVENKLFLCNTFEPSEHSCQILRLPPQERSERVLLLIVLCHIFMEGGSVGEDHMWQFMTSMNIDLENDPYYGNVKKLLTKDFPQNLHLEYKRCVGSDPATYEFREGVRATVEVRKKELLAFVSKVYGVPETHWPAHVELVEADERSRAQLAEH